MRGIVCCLVSYIVSKELIGLVTHVRSTHTWLSELHQWIYSGCVIDVEEIICPDIKYWPATAQDVGNSSKYMVKFE